MSAMPNTANMSVIDKLQLLRNMAAFDGRQWEANLIDSIIHETPLIEIDNRSDPEYLLGEPKRAFVERAVIPKVSVTYQGTRFEMKSVYVPTMTITGPCSVQVCKPPTESRNDAY